jgi:hypothetical protein
VEFGPYLNEPERAQRPKPVTAESLRSSPLVHPAMEKGARCVANRCDFGLPAFGAKYISELHTPIVSSDEKIGDIGRSGEIITKFVFRGTEQGIRQKR